MKKLLKIVSVFTAAVMSLSVAVLNVSAESDECEHKYTPEVITVTCNRDGCTRYTCSRCRDTYDEDVIKTTGHSYGKWIISLNETCTEKGIKYRVCSICDSSEEGHIEIGVVNASGHDFDDGVTVAPTCGHQGYTLYTCGECRATEKKDIVPALKHTYGEWKTKKEPKCDSVGEKVKECIYCDTESEGHYVIESIKKLEHKFKKTVVEPTYTEGGYTLNKCSECEYEFKDKFTDKLKGKVGSVELGEDITLKYEQSSKLSPTVKQMGDGVEYTVTFKSDDEKVATVDSTGKIMGKGMGNTVITCTVEDEYGNVVSDTVKVKVKFSFSDWMSIIRQVFQIMKDVVIGGLDFSAIKDLFGK